MKATELRIGNYINYSCIAMNINDPAYKIECGADIQVHQNHNYFKPILLTEQWLKDFGFIDDGRFKWNEWYWKGDFGIAHEEVPEDYWVWQVVDEGGIDMSYFKYVHQLQNLYFALTNEELTKK